MQSAISQMRRQMQLTAGQGCLLLTQGSCAFTCIKAATAGAAADVQYSIWRIQREQMDGFMLEAVPVASLMMIKWPGWRGPQARCSFQLSTPFNSFVDNTIRPNSPASSPLEAE